ncbi:MAG TPA: hypothetical protein VH619_17340 [Verrucomicrobiae bacterium]|nr:hypothetical protein [Verrucomicrobiae bacterium]
MLRIHRKQRASTGRGAQDLATGASLTELVAFQYSGGLWNKNQAESLAPLAALPKLQELVLMNLRVKEEGLRPLGECKTLQTLAASNQFETADYACLSVVLRHVKCEFFAPWTRVKSAFGGDTMIIGKRKPILSLTRDAEKIRDYEKAFRRLQAHFSSNTL